MASIIFKLPNKSTTQSVFRFLMEVKVTEKRKLCIDIITFLIF